MNHLVYFIYFTCTRHYPFFLRSLRSLVALRSKHLGGIFVYVDETDFLSNKQIESITKLVPDIKIFKSKKVTGWDRQTVEVETAAFATVAKDIHPDSYIAKTDSDIIFRGDQFFAYLLQSDADYAGCARDTTPHFIYPIGGCYFLKARIAENLDNYVNDVYKETLQLINLSRKEKYVNPPEDSVMQMLVKRVSSKTTYYIPKYSDSIMHFAGDGKKEMLKYDNWLYWKCKYYWRPLIGRVLQKIRIF